MINSFEINKADLIGIISASICIVHCISTPFLIASCSEYCCDENPFLKYTFLVVAFISIYASAKNCANTKIALLLWISFGGFLFSTLFQEEYQWLHYLGYFFALLIITGHILNIKYCRKCLNVSEDEN